ncbi:MAG TPA: hypothetical protein VFI73_08075 [Candidatus Nitrosopolaris sp.]|nr:hypothetical protein [Candidatus Nitrosopolaris sp.]
MKNLNACETTSAKGAGGLGQNQVLNFYSQALETQQARVPTLQSQPPLQWVIAALLIMLVWVLVVLAMATAA